MKRILLTIAFLGLALVSRAVNAEPINFDFASLMGSSIEFTGTGDSVDFVHTLYDFQIGDSSAGSLSGLSGNIDGTFTVGAITGNPLISESAPITSTGTFNIWDGAYWLTSDLDWKDITVSGRMFGVMNVQGAINLSNIAYSGSNPALSAIKDGTDQTVVLTFQFPSSKKKSLTDLMVNGTTTRTSFSGSVSAVPEPASWVMLSGIVAGLLLAARFRRKTA